MNVRTDGTAPRQLVAERITVGLVPKVADELAQLQERTGLSKTDLVNRAISMYLFVEEQDGAGYELVRRNRETGDTEVIRFL